MKKYIFMSLLAVVFLILSIDIIFYTSSGIDILFVVIYLLLVSQLALKLSNEKKNELINEKRTIIFAPLIFVPFLGIALNIHIIAFIINILVIILLYGYVYIAIKRYLITITEKDITVYYINGKNATMAFKDIKEMRFSWFYNLIILYDKEGNYIKMDITLNNFILVYHAIKKHVDPVIYKETCTNISIFYSLFLLKSNHKYL
jgi:hypothetical protein